MKITIRRKIDTLYAFEVKPELNQELWIGDSSPKPEVKDRLMAIVTDFMEKIDIRGVEIKDVIITGSLANYNWSKYSDIDLHILINFSDVDENVELVKRFFDAVRSNWNKVHDIRIKGYEVELYMQDEHESHASTGVYSLLKDDWVVKPQQENPEIDETNVTKKAASLMREIEKLEKMYERADYADVQRYGGMLKNKLKKMRRTGLETGGVFSVENLAFKVLRRSGHMGILYDTIRKAYDSKMSMTEQ